MKVFIIASLTADGLLAQDANDFVMNWTSPEDVQHFVKLTKEAGVLVMGSRTFDTILAAGRKLPKRKIVVYSSRKDAYPADVRPDPTEITSDPPSEVVARLKKEGFPAVAVCGGAQIYNLFMKSGVVTDLYLTVEPKVFGTGVRLFNAAMDINLKLVSCNKLNDNTLALHYQVLG